MSNETDSRALADQALLRERYATETEPGASAGPLNEVLRCLLRHRSVRAYRPDPLPPGTLELLVAAAQSAATSSNMQFCSVIAVQDSARKARLAQVAKGQAHIEQAPLFLVWLADLSRLDRVVQAQGRALESRDYLESFLVAALDAALAAQNAVVAAESLGLGTVYIGALRNDPERVAAELELPPHVMPVFGLCVGYEDTTQASDIKPRLPQASILFHERYAPQAELEHVQGYDRALSDFSRRHGMGEGSWTERVLARMGSVQGMTGRDRLRAMVKALGFELR